MSDLPSGSFAPTLPSERAPSVLSVVLPAYRAGQVIEESVATLVKDLDAQLSEWEIIVVDDGGHDVSRDALPHDERVHLIRLQRNQGKGAAVRAGMLAARGEVRVYTDADLPYGTAPLLAAAEYILTRGFHMVVGDRTLHGSEYARHLTIARQAASWVYSQVVGRLVTGGFFDTQCGFKAFRGDVAEEIFRMARVNRFAFDVEVVYIGLIARLDIKRVPVRLTRTTASSIRLGRDAIQMTLDVVRLKYHRMRGAYSNARLARLVTGEFDALSRTLQDSMRRDLPGSVIERSFRKDTSA